jgi:hypothetical protein
MAMDTEQKTESLARLVDDIDAKAVVLPEFQRDFVWEVEKTYDLFDSFIKDIFVGSLIYGVPSFEITVRELDDRPRAGKGSRRKLRLIDYKRAEIEKLVKTSGFRLLLDGQQRATSIYRGLKGLDPVYLILTPDEELDPKTRGEGVGKRSLESTVKEIRGDPLPGHVGVNVADVFAMLKGDMPRERDKLEPFLKSSGIQFDSDDAALGSPEFNSYLTQAKNLENLFRQEKLVAYYLLDTDEEKFALFFERSNSKGLQLNFIDILAAKLYAGFNLRQEIEAFEDAYPTLPLNRESIVRAISFEVSGGKDTGRAFILGRLTHAHFNEHWTNYTTAYRKTYDYLFQNRLVIHPQWMPYENMVIPLMTFLRQISGHDFGQIGNLQRRVIQVWYWASIFSRRYSSAAQTIVVDDSQNLQRVGKADFSETAAWLRKIVPSVKTPADLLEVSKQYDAVYKGVLNLVNFTSATGLVNWLNGDRLSAESQLEDHHIFPREYLRKLEKALDSDTGRLVDCVVNRTLIPKLTNIRISNRAPADYLAEIEKKNPKLSEALTAHLIPAELTTGAYDDVYEIFLGDRAEQIANILAATVVRAKDDLVTELGQLR